MEKDENNYAKGFRKFFNIVTILFTLFYVRWFWLTPSIPFLLLGIVWLLLHIVIALALKVSNNQNVVGISLFYFVTIFMANALGILFFNPRIVDAGIYNGAIHFLAAGPNYDFTYSPDDYYLTKWYGFFRFESRYVYFTYDRVRLFFDDKLEIVNIVTYDEEGKHERLIFGDADPPRYYTMRGTSSEKYRYYPTVDCIAWEPYTCMAYKHMIYQCELDNTGCTPLPFHYIGKDEYAYIEFNEETQEFEFFIGPDDEILVYSFGKNPRCHMEGCEILQP